MKSAAFMTLIAIVSGISSSLIFAPSKTEINQIGNVVYSVLGPEDFEKENGSGWVLLDGKTYQNSILSKQYGIATIPNGNGSFIRVLDTERDPQKRRDIDRQFGVVPGQFQGDATRIPNTLKINGGEHYHPISRIVNGFIAGNQKTKEHPGGQEWTTKGMNPLGIIPQTDPVGHSHTITGDNSETRPKNIVLYTYIKIN